MKSIKERITEYWKKERSKPVLEQLSDIFFILLIIAVLIPPVRRQLSCSSNSSNYVATCFKYGNRFR